MKIVVYNHYDQYALSRRQIEKLHAAMPRAFWSKVAEFHLCDDRRCVEVLEFNEQSKTVYFSFPVKEKTAEVVEKAVRELIVGLARIRSGSEFFVPLKSRERESYEFIVEEWLPKCLAELGRT